MKSYKNWIRFSLAVALLCVSCFAQNSGSYSVPTSGSGLNIIIGPGSCSTSATLVTFLGGSFPLVSNRTNYGYLGSNCILATNTTGFPSGAIPIFKAITGVAQVDSIVDSRPAFVISSSSSTNSGQLNFTTAGGVCDGVTDDTAALNAADLTLYNQGGGTLIFPVGTCLIAGQVTLPNDGAGVYPNQKPIHWIGSITGKFNNKAQADSGGTILNLIFNSPTAKIDTRGLGTFEIEHITLGDNSSDCASFLFTSNTTIKIHDDAFFGTTPASSGTPCNDAILLGGSGTTPGSPAFGAPFQGYGTEIRANFFNNFKRAVVGGNDAGSIQIIDNTLWSDNGNSTGGLIEFGCVTECSGNMALIVRDNLFEVANLKYALRLLAGQLGSTISGNSCWDGFSGAIFTNCVRFEVNSFYNFVEEHGPSTLNSGGAVSYTSDANTGGASNTNLFISTINNGVPPVRGFGIKRDGSFGIIDLITNGTAAGVGITNSSTYTNRGFIWSGGNTFQLSFNRSPNAPNYNSGLGGTLLSLGANQTDFYNSSTGVTGTVTNTWSIDSSGNLTAKTANEFFGLGTATVGALPAAAAGNTGRMIKVSDSTAVAAEGQTCVGGSTNAALAFSNGTVWKCF